jgi:hypothetical protein
MESRLKELLQDRAEEVRVDPAIPAEVVRRARSRRRSNVALAALLSVAVVAGSVVGVRAILEAEPPQRPAATGWPGIWPQDTRKEAEETQQVVDHLIDTGRDCTGDARAICLRDDVLWQLDAAEVATRYATQELGWVFAATIEPVQGPADATGPLVVHVEACSRASFCDPRFTAEVTVERLLRKDRYGLWLVTGADQTITPRAASEIVDSFLKARILGIPVNEFITPSAKEIYEQGEAGLSLYGGDAGPFAGFEVASREQAGEDTFIFLVRLSRDAGTVAESLLVGPGLDTNGDPHPVVVLSVSRVEFQEIDETVPPPTETPMSAEEQVIDFVTAFMEARLSGSGAEAYLSTPTGISYEGHDRLWSEQLYLYGAPHPDGDPTARYVDFEIESVSRPDGETCSWFSEVACQNAWEVVVVTDLELVDGGQPEVMQELLLVAPSDGAAAELADWMISGAARGPEPPGR